MQNKKQFFGSNNKQFKVISFISSSNDKVWKTVEKEWVNLFFVEPQYFPTKEFEKKIYELGEIDILFIDDSIAQKFTWNHYNFFQKMNQQFKLVIVKKDFDPKRDASLYKYNADDIVYTKTKQHAKWNSIAVLRRYWNVYSKPTTKIYKGIIADFIENRFIVNDVSVKLTTKEVTMFRYFMDNIGKKMTKTQLYKKVWEFSDSDNSRVVDQILFKLKKKIGKEYFHSTRSSGVSFS